MINQTNLEIVQKVSNKVAKKYVFGYYDLDDIKQEAMLIGIDAVENIWDGVRPLENFLSVHIPNRLKNFKRKNYCRLDIPATNSKRVASNESKKNLMEPMELFDFDLISEKNALDAMSNKELFESMTQNMGRFIRADYIRLINNVRIPKKRKLAVLDFIKVFYENW